MAESFSVGEIALFCRPGSPNWGREVTITGNLDVYRAWQPDGSYVDEPRYPMDAPFAPPAPHGNGWCAKPEWLRKRRPKQDWKSLCNLHDLPREVVNV